MPVHVFRYKPVQGRLAPIITVGIKLEEIWYPIETYVDSGSAYTLLHAGIAKGAWKGAIGFDSSIVLTPQQVTRLGRVLEPKSAVAMDGSLRRLAGYVNLEL